LLCKILVAWLAFTVAGRLFLGRVLPQHLFVRRVLVLGSGARIARLRAFAFGGRGWLFEPAADARDFGMWMPSAAALRHQRVWGILVTRDPTGEATWPMASLLDCKMRGVPVFDEAGFFEQKLGRIALDSIRPDWLLFGEVLSTGRVSHAIKRGLDIGVSLALLALTSPLMFLTALLIRVDTPGPVLYRQQRVGLHGRPFTLLKFRSMGVDGEQQPSPRWLSQDDPRVTRVGRFIRPLRIDELPQLINVLRGEMSMIGPRPERPHFVDQLDRIIPHYRERSYVKPGITGWAQVNYPYGASVEDARQKLEYDLYYVKNSSLLLDLKILIATIRVILFREGAR
jgi:sugar transferase (PEP-CTERM system associated)